LAIAAELEAPVTGLSSLPRPAGWRGDWIQLARDDTPTPADERLGDPPHPASEPQANGRLHWAPIGHAGLRDRMAAISAWLELARPSAFVSDVSVEVALLARLHGVPVITIVLPGERSDEPHRLGFGISTALIAAWPTEARGMTSGLDPETAARVEPVGGISGRPPVGGQLKGRSSGVRRVLVLAGAGGSDFDAGLLERARAETPDWTWEVIGGSSGRWVDDPWPRLVEADVIVTHAGQNAVAEVAAAQTPAIIVPQARPHDEQRHTGAVLAEGPWPAVVLDALPADGWPELLARAAVLDGAGWRSWNDGGSAARAAAVIAGVAASATPDDLVIARHAGLT
jgi:hypothetical protein